MSLSGRFACVRFANPEQHVRVDAPLVGLVHDQNTVALELLVAEHLSHHEAVRREDRSSLLRRLALEAHGVADLAANVHAALRGDALAHREDARARGCVAEAPAVLRRAQFGVEQELTALASTCRCPFLPPRGLCCGRAPRRAPRPSVAKHRQARVLRRRGRLGWRLAKASFVKGGGGDFHRCLLCRSLDCLHCCTALVL